MTRVEQATILHCVRKLRSGARFDIHQGERALLQIAGASSSSCSCPNYPSEKSKDCFAHTYITESVVQSETGLDLESARHVARIKARLKAVS